MSPPDRLDRVGPHENDLKVIAPLVLALKRRVGSSRLHAIFEVPLANEALGLEVVNEKEMSKGHVEQPSEP